MYTHDYPECTRDLPKVGPSADWCNDAWRLSDARLLFVEDDGTYSVLRPLFDLWGDYVMADNEDSYPDAAAVDAAVASGALVL